ncbi:MAG: serine/threonine protein kinase [Planctomycetes bacterium]|nr:serine/threonine protein kinase [Planctomycetota bacterium]
MVTTELGACEWFVWDLRRSNLIDRGRLDQIVGEFLQKNPRAEPPELAEFLIAQGILTPFQSERLLQGKTQGFVLGPFTLMDALGSGSMGTVYKAHNKTDNQWYAVKVLPRRSMWNVRIARRKVRSFEQCKHRTVVPFVDVGTAGGMHYLAWPFVEGETLDKIIQNGGKFPSELVAEIAMQIAEGLEVCHQQALFHGLLKPSNIMIGPDRSVYILDFGIGCLLAETEGESLVDTMSTANSVSSGLDCSSPESIMDPTNLTPTGDQYSLGCLMYFMLAGQYPFPDGSAAEKMMAHQFKQPQSLSELAPDAPGALIALVERLMQKKPEDRFQSAGQVVEELRPLIQRRASELHQRPKAANKPMPTRSESKPSSMPGPGPAKSPAPSTPTPKPQAIGALPTRNSLRGKPEAPKPAPPADSEDSDLLPQQLPVPGGIEDDDDDRSAWDTGMGPVGVMATALLACVVGYLAFRFFN